MAIDFPASPANGTTHTAAGVVWLFDGVKWKANSATKVDTAFAGVMPRFADGVVTDADVAAWYERHGYPPPGAPA